MPKITLLPHPQLCPSGITIEAPEGTSICAALLARDIAIEHACEMSCACTTCHVIVREGAGSLPTATDLEEDMLDKAWGLTAQSRLACQARLQQTNVIIEIPKYSINHARENH
jgi:ferredoxin, 2Fe-2S